MAKLKDEPITQDDLLKYLDESSDFAFELRVLKLIHYYGFACKHGGPYSDPITGKTRQFDIRATRTLTGRDNEGYTICLAVECKNLRPHCPLMVLTVPRTADESYHQVYWYNGSNANCQYMRTTDCIYPAGGPCGKSLAQVGKTVGGDLVGPDSEIYDKWVQALASGAGLVVVPSGAPDHSREWRAILPIVVVPDNTLWLAEHDENGTLKEPPKPAMAIDYFVGHEYLLKLGNREFKYFASHVEFLTFTGLEERVAKMASGSGRAWGLFAGAADSPR